jgi:hypothetical protein
MTQFFESHLEEATLEWLLDLGYRYVAGPDLAYGQPFGERLDPMRRDVILTGRLRQALERLNPTLPHEAQEEAFRKLTRGSGARLDRGERRRPEEVIWTRATTNATGRGKIPAFFLPSAPRGCRLPACEELKLYLLGDYEAARDPLQIFLLMLPNPHRSLGVP